MVYVADKREICYVHMIFFETIDLRYDALSFAKAILQNLKR
ncbi:MAG: hypothetical protein ACUVWV_02395 [Thermodesulfobacteriota bacterium]